jgi:uncharacterized lipoprotein YddW (UPF0748 family)
LFVSVIQNPPVLTSRDEITKLVQFSKKAQVQTLFVQIYRANQAWFPSKVGDSRPYEKCLKSVSEDPFALLIKEAHREGIEVHAWLNMLSLSRNENAPLLKKYGTDILTTNLKGKRKLKDYRIDNQYFLEPGDLRVRAELSAMVEEVLRAYPALDGIQFDYIRYPDMHPYYGHTKINTERFKQTTGLKTIEEENEVWKNWKRDQVMGVLKLLVKKARAIRPKIQISTTGLVPYSRAYHEGFQDWRHWLDSGLIDFVTLMCYSPRLRDLEQYILDAKKNSRDFKKVNIAIPAYKLAYLPKTFVRQCELCEEAGGRACVLFHYGTLLEHPALKRLYQGKRDLGKK